MIVRHIGIRPKYKLISFNNELKAIEGFKYERFPGGGYRLWSDRMLKSGCGHVIAVDKKIGELIYCKFCAEYFSTNQFEEL